MTNILKNWHNDNGLVAAWDGIYPSFDIFDAAEWNGDVSEGNEIARLIAAAPDMLAALQTLLDDRTIDGLQDAASTDPNDTDTAHIIVAKFDKARAAIAKATKS